MKIMNILVYNIIFPIFNLGFIIHIINNLLNKYFENTKILYFVSKFSSKRDKFHEKQL